MKYIVDVNWQELFAPQMSLLEMLIRGAVIYVALVLLLRVMLKRQAGKIALTDLVVISVVAGISRNPLVADAYSLTDGVGMIAVILGCGYAVDWLSFHSPVVHRLVHPRPVLLIRDGAIDHARLQRELMTEQHLLCELREHGVSSPQEVHEAWMEANGTVSVIKSPALRPQDR